MEGWQFEVEEEIRLRLVWRGPFLFDEEGPRKHLLEPCTEGEVVGLFDGPGLYAVASLMPERGGHHQLSYIGESDNLRCRLDQHWDDWLREQWRLEIFVCPLEVDQGLRKAVEALLIRAHNPPNNSAHIARSGSIPAHLRLWNDGRHPSLFPEVSSQHPWYV